MGWPVNDIAEAIHQSARKIRGYEAARWTIGIVRRTLPPQYALRTRPENLNEIALPMKLDNRTVNDWVSNRIGTHRTRIADSTTPQRVQKTFDDLITRFDDTFVSDTTNVLLWFSGKDILAGMADWLRAQSVANAGLFRASLRDWIIANPERTLDFLPEWQSLTKVLRA